MHDINVVIFFATALVLLWCGWYAWAVNHSAASNRALLALCVLLALGNAAQALVHVSVTLADCIRWTQISGIGWALYPAVAVHAALEVSRSIVVRGWRWLVLCLYAVGAVFLAYSFTTTMGVAHFVQDPVTLSLTPVYSTTPWDLAYSVYQYLTAGTALGVIWLWGVRSNRRRERKQAEVILFAGCIAIVIDIIRFYAVSLYPGLSARFSLAWAFEHLFFAAGLTYAITQHRFIVPTANLAANYIITHVKDLVVLTAEDGAILQVNPTAMRLLGWGSSELVGRKLTELFRYTDDSPVQWPLPGCSLASSAELDVLFRTRVGEEIPTAVTGSYLRDAYGDTVGIIVIGTDLRQTYQLRHEIAERIAADEKLRRAYETMESLVQQRTEELAHANAELIEEIAERERAEQALRASQKKFQDLFEHMNEGVDLCQVVRDESGAVIDWLNLEMNPAMDRLLEQEPGSGIGKLASVMLGPTRMSRYLRYISHVTNTGQPMTFEAYTPDLNKHLIISMILVQPELFAIITMDITERKEAILRLRESEEKYRGLFEHMSEGVTLNELMLNEQGEVVDWVVREANSMIARLFDQSVEELVGRRASALFDPEHFARFGPAVAAAAEGRDAQTLEFYSAAFRRHLDISLFAIEPGTVAMVVMDITARKEAEAALHGREEELQVMFNAPVGVAMLLNKQGTILAINEPGAQRFNRTATELVGTYAYDLLEPALAASRKREIDKAFDTGEMVCYEDERNDRVLAHTNIPVRDAQGRVTRVAVFVQDITARTRAEAALRDSEEKYRALTETSTDIIMRFDRDFRHIYVNAAVEQVTGLPPEAFYAKTHRELGYPPMMCDFYERYIAQVFETGQAADIQFDFVGKHGRVYFDWRLFPEFADDGHVRSVITSARDITALKEAEHALRTSEERFRRIVETFPGMIWMTKADPDYSASFLSDQVEAIFGYPKEEFLSGRLHFTDIVFPEELERVNAAVETALATRQAYSVELRFRHKTGRTVWVMEIGAGVYDEHGNLLYLIGSVLDITERKRAESALQESEWQYQALFAHMNEGFMLCEMVYDAAGHPVDWIVRQVNPAFAAMLGYTQTGVVGEHGSTIFGSTDAIAPLLATCAHVAETGVPARFDAELTTRDKHCVVSAFSPRIGRFAAIFYDITARKQAEEQVRVYQRELLELASELSLAEERERRRIATDLHDSIIQNLALVQIMLGALRAQAGEALTASFDDVRTLLTSSIQSARTLTFELSPPVLYELGLASALEWLGEQMQQRHGLPVSVRILSHFRLPNDNIRAFLFSAARELVMNVVKHARATQVTITMDKQDDTVIITIEDDGIGFDQALVEARRGGYGLFSIRERLRHIGGTFTIESRPGAGTRVTLTAPLPAVAALVEM